MKIRVDVTIDRPTLRPGRRRRTMALAAAMLAVLLPSVALANHLFGDVPAADPFHENISNLANAGVAAGCGGGHYCPKAAVTREQMAAFLNRGLGRVAEADFQKAVTGTASNTIGTFTITPGIPGGAVPGANQFLRAEFTGTIRFSNVTSCPCSVAVYLTANGSAFTNFASATTLSATNTYASLSTSGVLPISGSSPVTIALVSYVVTGGAAATAYTVFANVDAMTIPFGGAGGDVLSPAAVGAQGDWADDPLAIPAQD